MLINQQNYTHNNIGFNALKSCKTLGYYAQKENCKDLSKVYRALFENDSFFKLCENNDVKLNLNGFKYSDINNENYFGSFLSFIVNGKNVKDLAIEAMNWMGSSTDNLVEKIKFKVFEDPNNIKLEEPKLKKITKNDRVYDLALRILGDSRQLLIATEENSELIQAISNMHIKGSENYENLVEEIADVEIMIETLKYMYNIPRFLNKNNKISADKRTTDYYFVNELSKQIQSITKLCRDGENQTPETLNNLKQSLSSIETCLKLIKEKYNIKPKDVYAIKDAKLARLLERLENTTIFEEDKNKINKLIKEYSHAN